MAPSPETRDELLRNHEHKVLGLLADAGYDAAVFDPQALKLEYTDAPWELGVQNVLAVSRPHRVAVAGRLATSAEAHQ